MASFSVSVLCHSTRKASPQPLSLHFGHIAAITQKQWLKMLTQPLNSLVAVSVDCTDVLWHIVWIEDLSSQEHRVCGESCEPVRDAVSDSVDYFHPLLAEGLIGHRMVADSHSLKFKNTSAACAGEGWDRAQVSARFFPLSEQSSLGGHNPTPDRGMGQPIGLCDMTIYIVCRNKNYRLSFRIMLYRLFRLVANHTLYGNIFHNLDNALRSPTRHEGNTSKHGGE